MDMTLKLYTSDVTPEHGSAKVDCQNLQAMQCEGNIVDGSALDKADDLSIEGIFRAGLHAGTGPKMLDHTETPCSLPVPVSLIFPEGVPQKTNPAHSSWPPLSLSLSGLFISSQLLFGAFTSHHTSVCVYISLFSASLPVGVLYIAANGYLDVSVLQQALC